MFMKWKGLNYETYEEALKNYNSSEKWSVFDGTPENFNITHECLDRHVVEGGVAVRIKFSDGSTEGYSFRELSRYASEFANALEDLNVNCVAIALERSLQFYTSLFGALKKGAAVVVCSPLFGSEAVNYRLNDSKADLLVISRKKKTSIISLAEVDTSLVPHVITKEELLDSIRRESDKYQPSTSVNNLAVIQYTSGTTGPPKAVPYRHKSLVTAAPSGIFAYGIKDGDRFFCPSSPAWGHGFWGGTLVPLMFGVTAGTMEGKFYPERFLEALEEFKINNVTAAPTAYRKVLASGKVKKYDVKLEKLTYTGEPMDLDTFYEIKEQFGVVPCSLYGSTEVGGVLCNYAGFKDWKVKPGSLGKPHIGLEVAIIDDNGNVLPPKALGYIAVKRKGKWIKVGDAGVMDEDGYFWFKGRVDDVIKSSGYRIGPEEVESVINLHEAVEESAVIGVPDKQRGQIVKALIKLRPGFEPNEKSKRDIKGFTKERLSRYAYPREIEFIEELPKTVDGKIKRKKLREMELLRQETSKR